ncbi:hypothetical protein [Marinobacter sp. UBA2688]|jgi:hypothetical protein|uniref:hypothetical protein n=1 Tax=Marinobacter sp. UBA2688 TaxID=1946816 RepID=UPI00257A9C93|nr:hypothetical protein [Marinobacter sp. UBA2688]|tara:strand:+ start:414 stop:605 length:192 start_codon:yes stop_codon:yes gene_type:complete
MLIQGNKPSYELDAEAVIEKVQENGLAYIHGSGCAILKDGTWLQPEQWALWLAHLEEQEKEAC